MVLTASFCYGLGWVYNRRFVGHRDLGGLAQPTIQLVLASVQMVLVYTVAYALRIVPPPFSLAAGGATARNALIAILVLGALGTGMATWLHYDIIRAAGPTVGTMVTYVIPVVAVVLGVMLLHERLTPMEVLGSVLVISAPVMMYLSPRRRETSENNG
ncbi:hypothetical protein GCM10027418_12070 [Mariniluteicoccus endophyticus]